MLNAFLHGLIIAIGLTLPLGLQNIYLFNQGVNQPSIRKALPSILTAIVCDSLLIISSVLGVTLLILAIPKLELTILVIGFLFLIYVGFATWSSKVKSTITGNKPLSARKQIIFAASVSLFNPHAIIDAVGVIGTNSLHFLGLNKIAFASACILVSIIWFFVLTLLGNRLNKFAKDIDLLFYLNKFSAVLIWIVALYIGWLAYLRIKLS